MGHSQQFKTSGTVKILQGTSQIFFSSDRISLCSPSWLGAHYVAQAGFKLAILLPQPTQCWDYRYAPPLLAYHKILKNKV
jgi:hypothetical protein